ncbi:AAA family ATPase [Candidatus Woesearchaeota archaeon]|jgi:adenylate kinase|nr:AAA family ATPase [Candidatus Woesearchaeota archaeon]MBT5273077.1 AAA family ATPase [Candidatus Woesearchaeota archaeon]MBT6041016.1 AAA family ATPase [Candidatus Woesearchaeota archaeon]MBT6337608.1 AAA family ATPase [Candidatus Woesearchaeota archaeon]MBT7926991.1 AAA family ATPase [Candidatus Woesearchaeota archaeon]
MKVKTKTKKTKIVVVTGTPGTGKTTLAKKLSKFLNYELITYKNIISKKKLFESYDEERKCKIVDVKKLNKHVLELIKKANNETVEGIIIDSHLSHYFPKNSVGMCVVTKCKLKTLQGRLKKRRYNAKKVRENLDCEIFDVCLTEAEEKGHKCMLVDTSTRYNTKTIASKIIKNLKTPGLRGNYKKV